MIQKLIINALLAALPRLLCEFFGICLEDKDCPDGICESAIEELESLQKDVSFHPAKATSFGFKPDWSKLGELVDAVKLLVAKIREFLQVDSDDSITVG